MLVEEWCNVEDCVLHELFYINVVIALLHYRSWRFVTHILFVSTLMADLCPTASMTSVMSPPGGLTSAANREAAQCLLSLFIYEQNCYHEDMYQSRTEADIL